MFVHQAGMSIGGALGAALLFYLLVKQERRLRRIAFVGVSTVAVLFPFLIPSEARLARLFSAAFSAILVLKMWDVHLGASRGHRPSAREYVSFLINPASLVLRNTGRERQPGKDQSLRSLAVGLIMTCVGTAALFLLMNLNWSPTPLLLEHSAKVTCLFIIFTGIYTATASCVRLIGGYALRPTDYPLFARDPSQFWRGFNRVVSEFLREDVFRIMGTGHPGRAALAAFAVSALIHEYAFSVAVGRVQGFQTAFFLTHGLAVVGTSKWPMQGPVARLSTLAFNLISSFFFVASFETMAPGLFYQDGLPAIMADW